MTLVVTHSTTVAVADDGTSPVGTNEWNANHVLAGAADASQGGTGVTTFSAEDAGRLTLASATPIMTTTQSAKTTIFFTPYNGDLISLYDGTRFNITQFTELSQTTTDTTKSPAAVIANGNYDLFVWNDGGTIRCTRGPVWTSGNVRGTGAGTTELAMLNGIQVNANAIVNGPAANRGTYVGTVRSNASSQIDWILGAAASGGTAAVLNVWNNFNRRLVSTVVTDNGANYTYSSGTGRQARASAGNQVTFLSGLAEDSWSAFLNVLCKTVGVTGAEQDFGFGVDTTASMTAAIFGRATSANQFYGGLVGAYIGAPTLGSRVLYRMEASDGTNANTFGGGADMLGFSFLM